MSCLGTGIFNCMASHPSNCYWVGVVIPVSMFKMQSAMNCTCNRSCALGLVWSFALACSTL